METGFCKAQSDNLPRIDSLMMAYYFKNNPDFFSAEMRGVKANRSARDSYGDNAVGYVQLKRDGDICVVRGRITPEHKVRKKAYAVEMQCNEKDGEVISIQCQDCVAAAGGCKHAVAFLAWLHRRSEEPSPTEVKCYWKKSKLSNVGSTVKFCTTSQLGKNIFEPLPPGDGSLLQEFLCEVPQRAISNLQMGPYIFPPSEGREISLHYLRCQLSAKVTANEFCAFVARQMESCLTNINEASIQQADSPIWHELRYGRITASKIYAASRCNTLEGSLTEAILGAKITLTKSMKRGRDLEREVIKSLQNKKIKKCGLFLDPRYPFLGASPDGVEENFVVEVKCPLKEKTMKLYFSDGKPTEKHYAQMQLQMLFAKKPKALFCVAHPDFEETKGVTQIWVDFDEDYVNNIIAQAYNFWENAIFPRL